MNSKIKKINVAIDGPAGAGKSTIARLLANELGYIYVDTGAMYRAVALEALKVGIVSDMIEQSDRHIINLAERIRIQLIPNEDEQRVYVDEVDVTEAIRSHEVNRLVSHVAQIPEVRALLVTKQQQMAEEKGVVMDGRDIATHVLPHAELKIYLTASVQERARRRYKEMQTTHLTYELLEQEIAKRDEMDMNRAHSPLTISPDAIVIDCTNMTIPQVVDDMLKLCRTKMGGEQ